MRIDVLKTERLTLEPQVAAHAEEMFVVLSDPEIYRYENRPPASVEWLRERFTKLESRRSPDGTEHWLNWVIRLRSSELAGYVQATVDEAQRADIAYELCSRYWGRGIAYEAVAAMISELVRCYGVADLSAVFKRDNTRSRRLLDRLGFSAVSSVQGAARQIEADELLMCRQIPRRK